MTDSICSVCGGGVNVQESLIESSLDPIAGMAQVYQVDLVCPHCNDANFVHYTNDRLKKQSNKVGKLFKAVKAGQQYKLVYLQKQSAQHKREFDKFNRKVARITGQRLPIPVVKSPIKINWPGSKK